MLISAKEATNITKNCGLIHIDRWLEIINQKIKNAAENGKSECEIVFRQQPIDEKVQYIVQKLEESQYQVTIKKRKILFKSETEVHVRWNCTL